MKSTNFGPDTPIGTKVNYQLDGFKFSIVLEDNDVFAAISADGETKEVGPTPQKAVARLFVQGATSDSITSANVPTDILMGNISFAVNHNGVKINVEQRTRDWMAYLNDDKAVWDCGKIPQEAIGHLIFGRAEEIIE